MDDITLSAEDKQTLMLHAARLDAYRKLAQVEEFQMAFLVSKNYGIDLSENWNVDVEKGVLVRASDAGQPQ